MSETTETAASELTPADLLDSLRELGTELPVSALPTPGDLAAIVSGVVYYLATGSLQAPVVDLPTETEQRAADAENQRIAELESQLADANRRNAAATAGPSPVAPAPTAPAPATTPPPTAPIDEKSAPVETEPPAATVEGPSEAELLEAWRRQQEAGATPPPAGEGASGS